VESLLLSPAWTLCYEEQFYALAGLMLLIAPRFFFPAMAFLTAVVIAGAWFLPSLGVRTQGLFLDGQWLMFAAGSLVYYTLNYVPTRFLPWCCLPLYVGVLYGAANPGQLLDPRVNEPNLSYLCAFAFALLLIVMHRWDTPLSKARLARPLFFCGEMCYSLYLIHWPVVTLVSWTVNQLGLRNPFGILLLGVPSCLCAALALARLFHRVIERRFWNPGYSS
jgi:peptidoglycan/LPS O-acetylase OafA/YrhL